MKTECNSLELVLMRGLFISVSYKNSHVMLLYKTPSATMQGAKSSSVAHSV